MYSSKKVHLLSWCHIVEHINLVAEQQGSQGPFIISVLKSKLDDETYPIIVWSPSGEEKIFFPASNFKSSKASTKDLLQSLKQLKPELPFSYFKRVDDEDFANGLYKLESSQVCIGNNCRNLSIESGKLQVWNLVCKRRAN